MSKDFPEPVSERLVEEEIRMVMGEHYVGLAAPGSPKALPDASGDDDTFAAGLRQKQLLKEIMLRGWQPTEAGRALLEHGELSSDEREGPSSGQHAAKRYQRMEERRYGPV